MKSFSVTDVGQKRELNEDYVFASVQPVGNLPNLFVIADGMGGHNAGDFASCYAVQVLLENIKKDMNFNPVKIIRHAMETANAQLIEQASKVRAMAGMGTTMVAVTVVGHYAYVANVGDSRLYVLGEDIQQITKDHSLVQEMVRMGELTQEEVRNHPDKNIITRALGAGKTLNVDFFDVRLEPDQKILLCSDGLSNMLTDQEILDIVKMAGEERDPATDLVRKANENGGKDNISVIVVEPFTNEVKKC